jgi:fumarate reductase subunit D
MSEQETPQDPGAPSEESTAPPEPPPVSDQGTTESPNRNVMIVLAYLGILCIIPLLMEKDDREVQWHAKNGLLMLGLDIVLLLLLGLPILGCFMTPIVLIAILVIHVVAIVKGLNGERFMVPVLSEYASKF